MEIRTFIRSMAAENSAWGAPKIHGELLKLGFVVSERAVARYLQRMRHRGDPAKRWLAFQGYQLCASGGDATDQCGCVVRMLVMGALNDYESKVTCSRYLAHLAYWCSGRITLELNRKRPGRIRPCEGLVWQAQPAEES